VGGRERGAWWAVSPGGPRVYAEAVRRVRPRSSPIPRNAECSRAKQRVVIAGLYKLVAEQMLSNHVVVVVVSASVELSRVLIACPTWIDDIMKLIARAVPPSVKLDVQLANSARRRGSGGPLRWVELISCSRLARACAGFPCTSIHHSFFVVLLTAQRRMLAVVIRPHCMHVAQHRCGLFIDVE